MAQKLTVQDGILQFGVLDNASVERIALTYNDGSTNVDNDFNKVSLLLHFDGADSATTTTDSSSNVHSPITFAGNAQIDTAQSVFGNSSLLLDGTGDWLTIADNASWDLGAGDFTIECAVRFTVVSTSQFVSHYEPSGSQRAWSFGYDNTNGLRFLYSADGIATTIVDRAWTPVINTQYRVAITRIGSNLYFFIDAVLQGAAEPITATIHNSTHVLTIGALGNSGTPTTPLNGHLDEMRITKDIGRYSATYTLATEAFPNVRTIVGTGIGNSSANTVIEGASLNIESPTTFDNVTVAIDGTIGTSFRIGTTTSNLTQSTDGTDFTTAYTGVGLLNITGSPSIDYAVGAGIVPFRIGGDLGDTTTPYYRFYNTGTNVDRRLAFFSEDGGFSDPNGWIVDLRFGAGSPNNSIVIGSTGASADIFTIHETGWSGSPGGNSLRALDTTNTDYIDISHDGTSVHIDTVTTDSIIFENTTADFFTLDFTNNNIINNAPIEVHEGGVTVFGATGNTILAHALKATFNVDVVAGIVTAVSVDSTSGTGYIDGTGFTFLLVATAGGGDGAAQITYDVVDGSVTNPTVSIGGTTYTNGTGQLVTASDVNGPEGAGNLHTTIGELHVKAKSGIVNIFGSATADNTVPDVATTLLRFKSLDDNLYGTLGFAGEDYELINRAYGSTLAISGTTGAGATTRFLTGAPGSGTSLYHTSNVLVFRTATTGIQVQGVTANNPGTSGVQDQLLEFVNSGIQPTASLGFAAGTALRLINIVDGGALDFRATSAGGVLRNVILGDPDDDVKLYDIGVEVARTLPASSGGWEVNNTVTGAGFERVLTISDVLTSNAPLNLIGDINTATPPTTEAITNLLQFRDLADNDTIGSIGYTAGNDLIITNSMETGLVQIKAQNTASLTRSLIDGDPDGRVTIYHPAAGVDIKRLETVNSGIVTIYADTSSDSANNLLAFAQQGTTSLGVIGNTSTEFIVRSDVPSKSVTLIGERSTSANVDLAEFDPDNGAFIGAAQFTRLTTQLLGIVAIRSDASTDTEARLLAFEHQDTVQRAVLGHETTSEFVIRNQINSGNILITAEDAGGTARTFLTGDPDATTILRADTDLVLEAGSGTEAVRYAGDGTDIIESHEANVGLVADVGSAQGNGVITSSYNVYSTVANIGDAATLLSTFSVGTLVHIKNDGVNSMDVFPALGDDAGSGTNTAVSIASGDFAVFMGITADTTWTKIMGGTA